MNDTIQYYDRNAEAFAGGTMNVDFSEIQSIFLSYLSKGAKILDFGCGAGRDAKCFVDKGFCVDAVDGSEKLCEIAKKNTGLPVRRMLFSELDSPNAYDGIWACASILHMPKEQLPDVFQRMVNALHDNGIIYTSFKYGIGEKKRGERFFSDFTEETMCSFLEQFPELAIEKMWVTTDVRPDREEEKWLNMILRKSMLS